MIITLNNRKQKRLLQTSESANNCIHVKFVSCNFHWWLILKNVRRMILKQLNVQGIINYNRFTVSKVWLQKIKIFKFDISLIMTILPNCDC